MRNDQLHLTAVLKCQWPQSISLFHSATDLCLWSSPNSSHEGIQWCMKLCATDSNLKVSFITWLPILNLIHFLFLSLLHTYKDKPSSASLFIAEHLRGHLVTSTTLLLFVFHLLMFSLFFTIKHSCWLFLLCDLCVRLLCKNKERSW